MEVMGKAEISCINVIINKSNGHFMSLNELQKVYKPYANTTATFKYTK